VEVCACAGCGAPTEESGALALCRSCNRRAVLEGVWTVVSDRSVPAECWRCRSCGEVEPIRDFASGGGFGKFGFCGRCMNARHL
jgi:hypothetical protein